MPKKKVKMEAKEQSSPSTTTMEDKSKIENLIALAVAPSRLTQPALEDSPESWGKLIELTIKSPLVSGAVTTIASMPFNPCARSALIASVTWKHLLS